ncbi:unnamed protein product [Gadus morhua 'NCC']
MAWGWSQQVARPTTPLTPPWRLPHYVSVTCGELPVTGELDRPTAVCDISSVSDRTGSACLRPAQCTKNDSVAVLEWRSRCRAVHGGPADVCEHALAPDSQSRAAERTPYDLSEPRHKTRGRSLVRGDTSPQTPLQMASVLPQILPVLCLGILEHDARLLMRTQSRVAPLLEKEGGLVLSPVSQAGLQA